MAYPNSSSIQYLKLFAKNQINPYRLVQVLFAIVYLKGYSNFSCDLQEWFYQQKQKDEFKEILKPMYFRNNGVCFYSRELEEALSMLFMVGLIRKGGSPVNFGVMFLEYTIPIADQILGEIQDKNILKTIYKLADQFVKDVKNLNENDKHDTKDKVVAESK